jgi:putative hemolysin
MHKPAVVLTAVLALLPACTPRSSTLPQVGLANPASINCARLGGQVEIRREPAGEVGYCLLPDGRAVEEFALLRETEGG